MRLSAHVREIIRAEGGHIRFDRYMQEVLYAPGLGYYAAGSEKFGAAGDFVTAPEVSPVFGRCLARQCAEVLRQTGGGILEIGAGSGRLAADVLGELTRMRVAPAAYRILEVSADLRERQAEKLRSCDRPEALEVEWLDRLPQGSCKGVLLANEVLDALPVRCFEIRGAASHTRVMERVVVAGEQGFGWGTVPADDTLSAAVAGIEELLGAPLPEGYRSEVCASLNEWLAGVLGGMSEGVAIFSDYGLPRSQYYLPERAAGTLISHYRHRAHDDPFMHVGLQDLSAWVDFTALAEAAAGVGWSVAGFTTQAHFLIGAGLETVMADCRSENMSEQLRLASEIRTLTLPGEMGERFKFMALARNFNQPLSGFEIVDMRGGL